VPPTLYRDTGYSLNHLIEDIKVGRIGLPDIQRPFVWSATKIRDLFDSMYRGYPIGTLMFWETGAEVGTRQIGIETTARSPQLLIVDGQQRLTSLFAVLTGRPVVTKSFEERRIRIAFRPEDQTFEVTDAAIERDAYFIPDITALWSNRYKTTVRQFFERLRQARDEDIPDPHKDELEERIDRVRDLREFRFQVVELGASADEEQVAEIFVRINSEGVKLNQADFILTLMSVHWEKGRRQLEDFSRAAVDRTITGPIPRIPSLSPARINCCGSPSRSLFGEPDCSTSTTSSAARTSIPVESARSDGRSNSSFSPRRRRKYSICPTGTNFSNALRQPDSEVER
jgi:hypothetical protein